MGTELATIVAALIGAAIGVVGLIVSKESKVSEFRQQWIDGLRADISSLIGVALAMQETPMEASHSRDLVLRLEEFQCRITLRFKADDAESDTLRIALRNVVRAAYSFGRNDKLHSAIESLRTDTQILLKNEWERVKAGEKIYRLSLKYARAAFIVLSLVVCIWSVVGLVLIPMFTWLPRLFKG